MKNNKGITLIALIITIIILIILTAVTINNVIGTDLIGFATKAVENYTDAARDEADKVDKLAGTLNNQGVGEDSKVRAGEIVAKTEKDNYTDVTGRKATVPAGFKVSTKSSEQYIKDGLVIQDEDGNEFVWVPCTTTQYNDAKDDVMDKNWPRNTQYETNGGTDGRDWRDDYTPDDEKKLDEVYTGENNLPTDTWEKNQTTVGSTSIGDYGGFYIARYEAGIPEEASFHIKNIEVEDNYVDMQNETFTVRGSNDATTNKRGSVADTNIIRNYKPVSKQGVQAWNYITQPNSKMVAENMYKGSKDSKGNNVGVKSYLVDSQAWNHICSNIFEVGEDTNIDSTDYGNYFDNRTFIKKHGMLWAQHVKNNGKWEPATKYMTDDVQYSSQSGSTYTYIELATGSSDNFKKYNIYDMAGNMWDWTSSHNIANDGQMHLVIRGGSFMDTHRPGSVALAAGDAILTYTGPHVGFRVVLYIQ